MKRFLALGLTLGLLAFGLQTFAALPDDPSGAKEALQELQAFIGQWKGEGGPDRPKAPAKDLWSEKIEWSWRFKGDDAWLTMAIKDGKYFKSGELRYVPEKKAYQLTMLDKTDKKEVFEGKLKKDVLTLERTDPSTKQLQQIVMNTAAEGVRFIFRYNTKSAGTTLLKKEYLVQATREGESLGKAEKKNECVVSGGLGTMPITYKGETFYICCSGCRDAFNENPEKYIKEFKAKNKK